MSSIHIFIYSYFIFFDCVLAPYLAPALALASAQVLAQVKEPDVALAQVSAQVKEPDMAPAQVSAPAERTVLCLFSPNNSSSFSDVILE